MNLSGQQETTGKVEVAEQVEGSPASVGLYSSEVQPPAGSMTVLCSSWGKIW